MRQLRCRFVLVAPGIHHRKRSILISSHRMTGSEDPFFAKLSSDFGIREVVHSQLPGHDRFLFSARSANIYFMGLSSRMFFLEEDESRNDAGIHRCQDVRFLSIFSDSSVPVNFAVFISSPLIT